MRVDANNLWRNADEAIVPSRARLSVFRDRGAACAPNQYDELAAIADALDCPIVLDESCAAADQLGAPARPADAVAHQRARLEDGRVAPLARCRRAARAARIGIIVGAQVGETSLLTRAALTVAPAPAPALVAQEGAFGTWLLERDVCDPPLMFGQAESSTPPRFRLSSSPGLASCNVNVSQLMTRGYVLRCVRTSGEGVVVMGSIGVNEVTEKSAHVRLRRK